MTDALPCPCNTGRRYADCCGRLHTGAPAVDAAQLMRSRYSAYVRGDAGYLWRTWHRSTRPSMQELSAAFDPATRWLGLEVRAQRVIDANHAEVEFVARYRIGGGRAVRMQERSRFVHEGEWLYVDGDVEVAGGRATTPR